MQTLCSYIFTTIATAAANPHVFVYWFTNAFIKTPLIVLCGMKTKKRMLSSSGKRRTCQIVFCIIDNFILLSPYSVA